MRAMWHDFYIGLACQNCFAYSVLVLMALSMALSIKTEHNTLRFDWLFAVAALRSCCSVKFRNIHRETSVLESLFNKVVGLEAYNFIKNRFRHTCLPVNIAKFLKNSFFYRKPPVVAYMSTRKTKEEESVDQKRKNFSNVFPLSFSSNFISFDFRFHFLFLFHLTNWKMSRVAFISSFIQKQAFRVVL